MSFDGFPPATSVFLEGLTENNNKAWFDAHRRSTKSTAWNRQKHS